MKLLLTGFVLLLCVSTTQGAMLWLQDLDSGNPAPLSGFLVGNGTALSPSDVASVGIFVQLGTPDLEIGDAAVAGIWLDNIAGEGLTDDGNPTNYEITDLAYHGYDVNGPGNPGWNYVDRSGIPNWDGSGLTAPITPDEYVGVYGYDSNISDPPGAPLTTFDTPALIDELVIHMIDADSLDHLYFENGVTTPPNPQVPTLVGSDGTPYVYGGDDNPLVGSLDFLNAWADDSIAFDAPFIVEGVPEPASLVLLSMGAIVLLRRR